MAHRGEREVRGGADRDRVRRPEREAIRDPTRDPREVRDTRDPRDTRETREAREAREREPRVAGRGNNLNEYFVDGEGIHRDVMQRDICRYLGAEATCRPGSYNGQKGYMVKAIRPFTAEMIEDMQKKSLDYVSENRVRELRGHREIPYQDSQAYRDSQHDDEDDMMIDVRPGEYPRDVYPPDLRYKQGGNYPSSNADSGYGSMTPGYPAGQGYPPQVGRDRDGYPPGPGYPLQSGYPGGAPYSQGAPYPSTTAYAAPGYPAPSRGPGIPMDPNYGYPGQEGDYPNQPYAYRPPGGFPGPQGGRDADRIPRGRGPEYAYVQSPPGGPARAPAYDDRYDGYAQSIPTTQARREAYPVPGSRGTPGYDGPPQPRDGFPQPRDGFRTNEIPRDDPRRRRA